MKKKMGRSKSRSFPLTLNREDAAILASLVKQWGTSQQRVLEMALALAYNRASSDNHAGAEKYKIVKRTNFRLDSIGSAILDELSAEKSVPSQRVMREAIRNIEKILPVAS